MTDAIPYVIFTFGWVTAWFMGRHHGQRHPLKPLERESERAIEQKPVCGCSHHYAVHDMDGVCTSITQGITSREPKIMKVGFQGEDHEVHYVEKYEQIPCPCKRYTGPEPLPTYIS